MSLNLTVMKFGGTSVENAHAFARVGRILRMQNDSRLVVVVSAISGVTDALLNSVRIACEVNPEAARRTLERHFERHREVARALLPTRAAVNVATEIEDAGREIAEALKNIASGRQPRPLLQDVIVSYGERLSATLLTAVLVHDGFPAKYVDARHCVITDAVHGQAAPVMAKTFSNTRAALVPLLEAGEIPVLGGFIAASEDGTTTTLGRGGSDYTATLVGAALGAREVQIWTDVPGVLTANPNAVKEARTIPQLSYAEAAAMACFGAKMLHPKTVEPLIAQSIPLRVGNSRAPTEAGTLVCAEVAASPHVIKAIAHKPDTTVVHVTLPDRRGSNGDSSLCLKAAHYSNPSVNVLTASETSILLTVDETGALDSIREEMLGYGSVVIEKQRALACLVGEGLREVPDFAAHILSTLKEIDISFIAPDASGVYALFGVDEARVGDAVRQLHKAFFQMREDD
ncbi:MAG: aspartate kinase [Acidobacteria bacterium]|nr:aspartate kinase [Acidobacteriota bacterium]